LSSSLTSVACGSSWLVPVTIVLQSSLDLLLGWAVAVDSKSVDSEAAANIVAGPLLSLLPPDDARGTRRDRGYLVGTRRGGRKGRRRRSHLLLNRRTGRSMGTAYR
jgi:hypothetical protein